MQPDKTEYHEFYAGYVRLVTEDDIVPVLATQANLIKQTLATAKTDLNGYRYEADKWTLNQLLGHINDTERIFAYRALRIIRGDQKPLTGFDQDEYVANSKDGDRPLDDLADEFFALRSVNTIPFFSLSGEDWSKGGFASGHPITVRAIAYIMAGHVRHHLNIIKERYIA